MKNVLLKIKTVMMNTRAGDILCITKKGQLMNAWTLFAIAIILFVIIAGILMTSNDTFSRMVKEIFG